MTTGARSAHHVGRTLEVHVTTLAPRLQGAVSVDALLIRPDVGRAFGWASEVRRARSVTMLVLPSAELRPAWERLIATGDAVEAFASAERRSPAVTDGLRGLTDALRAGRARLTLLRGDESVLSGRSDDVLVLTDADGGLSVILRGHAQHDGADRPDVERVLVLDGEEVPGLVLPLTEELHHAAHRLLPDAAEVALEAADDGSGNGLGDLMLRDYQQESVAAWIDADRRGVLSMATGSGKTVTAIACIDRVRPTVEDGLVVLVTAPLVHLVEQWADELERLLGVRVVRCHTSRAEWSPAATTAVQLVRSRARPLAVLASTYETAALPEFADLLARVDSGSLMVVADESHHLSQDRAALMPAQAEMRLGLTATPAEDLDVDGAEDYLGPVVAEYPLTRAIADGVLCPYEYLPLPVTLTDDELAEFTRLSGLLAAELQALSGRKDRSRLQRLMQERSDLLDSATGKIQALAERIDAGTVRHTIIYCSGREQLVAAQKVCWDRGVNAQPFTGEESAAERRRILERFASGRIPALVAIRCLDEGVDVPPARRAIMLRSSANPTQSVQRRGRLLRRHEGKTHAVIEDLVAVGPDGRPTASERERVGLFAADAANGAEVMDGWIGRT